MNRVSFEKRKEQKRNKEEILLSEISHNANFSEMQKIVPSKIHKSPYLLLKAIEVKLKEWIDKFC